MALAEDFTAALGAVRAFLPADVQDVLDKDIATVEQLAAHGEEVVSGFIGQWFHGAYTAAGVTASPAAPVSTGTPDDGPVPGTTAGTDTPAAADGTAAVTAPAGSSGTPSAGVTTES